MDLTIIWTILFWVWSLSEIAIGVVTRTKRSEGNVQDRGSLITLWVVIFPSMAVCQTIRRTATGSIFQDWHWALAIGLAILIAGLAIRWTAIVSLGKSFSANVATRATQKLHRTGLFRFVRHPSYLGLLLVFLAVGLRSNSWLGLCIATLPTTAALLYRVRVEEAALVGAFGDEYVGYCRVTSRLIPGVF